jgi:hypothetical protein
MNEAAANPLRRIVLRDTASGSFTEKGFTGVAYQYYFGVVCELDGGKLFARIPDSHKRSKPITSR